jgi:adenylate cyclase
MVVDFVVVIVLYQFLRNRAPWLPLAVPLFLGLVVALVVDAAVYKLISHGTLSWESFHVTAKAQAGVAAGLPAALYCALELRRRGGVAPEGGLERRALELVDLRRRISKMAQELAAQQVRYKDIKDTFRRYVSPDVVDTIMEDPSRLELGGEKRDVTILFADIRGYSTLAEALDPSDIITLLNIYFERVSDEILGNRGMINEFEGDGVLAVFGAPLALPEHADCAVRAGLGMLRTVEELNRTWAKDGTTAKWNAAGMDGLAIRVGIHSGPVVAGNVGSQARTKYAVIGDTVNTAARVEGLNKTLETSLLITQATRDALRDEALRDRFGDRGSHPVKGRLEAVRVYTPTGSSL